MRHSMLLAYQWITGSADVSAGVLLYLAPAMTLHMVGVDAPLDATPYVSYIGAFVLSVGLSCLYGALLLMQETAPERLETVWLLTAFARSAVAIYVIKGVLAGQLGAPWMAVALFDAACVAIQAIGLKKKWLIPGPGSRVRVRGTRIGFGESRRSARHGEWDGVP